MATVNAVLGNATTFLGGADDLVCTLSAVSYDGVTIETTGFTLNNATVQAKGPVSSYDTVAITDAKYLAKVGEKMPLAQIRISGVAAGNYVVRISN